MLVLFSTSDTCTLPDVALRLPKALPTFDFRDHLISRPSRYSSHHVVFFDQPALSLFNHECQGLWYLTHLHWSLVQLGRPSWHVLISGSGWHFAWSKSETFLLVEMICLHSLEHQGKQWEWAFTMPVDIFLGCDCDYDSMLKTLTLWCWVCFLGSVQHSSLCARSMAMT